MSNDYEYFTSLVKSVDALKPSQLRQEILSRPVEFWDPDTYWAWKESDENYKLFAHFIISATRSLDGTEDDNLPITLVSNLHLVIPWCCENVAELSMLLLEEFINKKMSRISSLLDYVSKSFFNHPDFSDRKQELLDEFTHYRTAVNELKFNHLSTNWIDEVYK